MRMALGSGKVVTVLNELYEIVDTLAVYLREEGDDSLLIVSVVICVQVNVSTIYYVNPTNTLHTDLEIYDQS